MYLVIPLLSSSLTSAASNFYVDSARNFDVDIDDSAQDMLANASTATAHSLNVVQSSMNLLPGVKFGIYFQHIRCHTMVSILNYLMTLPTSSNTTPPSKKTNTTIFVISSTTTTVKYSTLT